MAPLQLPLPVSAFPGMIRDFLQEGTLGALARLVLVNAIHFKGHWQLPFLEAATRQRVFHKLDGSTISVPMMEQMAQFNYGERWGVPSWRGRGQGRERLLSLSQPEGFLEYPQKASASRLGSGWVGSDPEIPQASGLATSPPCSSR